MRLLKAFTLMVCILTPCLVVPHAHAQTVNSQNRVETWRLAGVAIDLKHAPDTGSMVLSEVIALPNHGYRLYYGARKPPAVPGTTPTHGAMNIEYAESSDGDTWTYGGVALASLPDPNDPEYELGGPSFIWLPDGKLRMYYQASPQFSTEHPGMPPHFQLLSAISSDGGKTFKREGTRITNHYYDPTSIMNEAAHGRVIKLKEDLYAAYLSGEQSVGNGTEEGIYLFTSDDGLKFTYSKKLYAWAHDPVVFQVGDVYRLYASVDTYNSTADSALMDTSNDGLTWNENKSRAVFLDRDGTRLKFADREQAHIGDICGVMVNGKLRLFSSYFGADRNAPPGIAFYDLVDQKDVPAPISSGTDIPNPPPPTGLGGILKSFINPGNAPPDNQAPQSSADISSGLILHYDFDAEPVGGKVLDKSGHGNDGQAVGIQWVADGHQGGAVLFGLTNSYITVPNNDSINPPNLTLSAWIKTSYQDPIWRRIFDKCYNKGYDLTMGGDYKGKSPRGRVYMETVLGGANSPNQVTDGNWHHVVGVFGSSNAEIYLDGWLVGTHRHSAGVLTNTPYDLTIGANRSNPNASLGEVGASFNGVMDDVMMFNRALSADEVQALFISQGGVLGPKPQPPPPRPPAGTPAKPSAADRLKQLKQLLDQGLINQDQYDQKKKEIIDSM